MASHAALASSRIPTSTRLPSKTTHSFPAQCFSKKLDVAEFPGLRSSGCVTFAKNARDASFIDGVAAQLTPKRLDFRIHTRQGRDRCQIESGNKWDGDTVALVVVASATTVAEAAERNGNTRCLAECFFDCAQIKIFNDEECKRECGFACAKKVVGKNLNKYYDTEIFPFMDLD